ncbi:unnamed protein product, partial [Choristocarpus tenellus]
MNTWTTHDLSAAGYAVHGLVGARIGKLFQEHVVRFSLSPRRADNK